MNKIHPAVIVAGVACGLFAAFAVMRSLLTSKPEAPKALTSDIPATPVADTAQPEPALPAASGTGQGEATPGG
jgi:hypothetical protein